ncbi:SpoIID/LytB domain-containing protein [Gracilibacillus marinus]|uniref:SpoIID/LytB domain-containing protein n=1 Tax=Gracilibacillus marinus TaxID=630535 RepID=A0ABV8VS95_9BACI
MKKVLLSLVIFSGLFLFVSLPISANTGLITVKLVNFLGNKTQITMQFSGEHSVASDNYALKSGENYTIKKEGNSLNLYLNNTRVKSYGSTFKVEPEVYGGDNYILINGRAYLGTMTFGIDNNGYIRPSNTLPLSDYLKGVVPIEMYRSWPLEALKAQAVAARTYATNYLNSSNINDTVSYQVYEGYTWGLNDGYQNSTKAVEETKGQIITYNGRSIKSNAVYTSSNGGKKLSNVNSWGSLSGYTSLISYLKGGSDPYDALSQGASPNNNRVNWNFSLTKKQIDLSKYNTSNPGSWWNQAAEIDDRGIVTRIKNWMKNNNLINEDYEMKITQITNVSFTTEFSDTDVLQGKISFKYILKNKANNTYRMKNGKIEEFDYDLIQRSYSIRSIVGSSIMYGPYVKSVGNSSTMFTIYGGGFGHGIGMSQFGAYVMAGGALEGRYNPYKENYSSILNFYYPGTLIVTDQSLLQVPVKLASVSTDKPSPQIEGTVININAVGSGGNEMLYKFNVYDGEQWKVLKDYSFESTYAWKPTKPGNYKFSIHVKDKYSTEAYDDYKTFDYVVDAEPVDIVNVSTDKLSPQTTNTEIRLTANAIGNGTKLYKFNVFDGNEWIVARDYNTSPTFDWKPTKAGNYKFSVHVKSQNSLKPYDDYSVLEYSIVEAPVLSNIKMDVNSPQYTDSTINFEFIATGGLNPQYKVNVFDGNEWKVLRDYSSSNTFAWNPTVEGDYKFSIHVKDAGSQNAYDHYKVFNYTIYSKDVIARSLTTNLATPQKEGTTIRLTANATGGSEKLYKFHVYNGEEWKVLRDYNTSNVYDWKPSNGNYKLVVHVKDRNSTKEYDSFTYIYYNITDVPVRVTSLVPSLVSPQKEGTTISLTANATGGSEKLYKFHVFNGKTWQVLRDYDVSNTVNWTPSNGNYKLVVHVKDRNSSNEYDSYEAIFYDIVSTPVNIQGVELSHASPQAENTAITLKTNATGGSTKLYKINVYDGKEWKVLRDYSTSNEYTWSPNQSGEYKFSIHVKDKDSKNAYDDYEAFIYQVVDSVSMSKVNHSFNAETGELTIEAVATGGTERLYKYFVLQPNTSEWIALQDFTTNSVFKWIPEVAGEYKFSVHVKDINSSKTYDDHGAFFFTK